MGILGFVGAALLFAGWIWAVIAGFKSSRLWGALNLLVFLQPVIAIISALFKKISWLPILLMIVGSLLAFLGNSTALEQFQ